MTRPTLFDTPTRARTRRGTVAIVPRPAACPTCHHPLVRLPTATQPALFIHGGYGAAQRTTRDLCTACGWTRTAAIDTVNPRHLDPEQ